MKRIWKMLPDFDHSGSQDGICGHCEHNAKVRAMRREKKNKSCGRCKGFGREWVVDELGVLPVGGPCQKCAKATEQGGR